MAILDFHEFRPVIRGPRELGAWFGVFPAGQQDRRTQDEHPGDRDGDAGACDAGEQPPVYPGLALRKYLNHGTSRRRCLGT
ncbi:hypothetical protein [Saccharopolyspora hattusasensis]|uniref:hypothetical protein n=1 Tax=Saccharopolyspora hattusasensis TaxID=1128679 RepID=UPI003D952B63